MHIDEINLAIINHLRDGRMPFKQIAESLALSEGTVRNHMSAILAKLGLRNRTQVAVFYYRSCR